MGAFALFGFLSDHLFLAVSCLSLFGFYPLLLLLACSPRVRPSSRCAAKLHMLKMVDHIVRFKL